MIIQMKMYRIYMPMKRWFQRRTRGWDDSDTWALDMTMAELMLPRFKRFRELHKTRCGPSGVFFPKDTDWSNCEENSPQWAKAVKKQDEVYDDIEYFLNAIASKKEAPCNSEGYISTDEIERYLTIHSAETGEESHQIAIHKQIRDERYFRGKRYLWKYMNTLWW